MIEQKAFCLFADCAIRYEGRASSNLARGNYLIIYKKDGSVSIHAAIMLSPRNYISSGSKFSISNNDLIFTRKKETVTISIFNIISITYLDNWSEDQIVICRTERELAEKIFNNWHDYFDGSFEVIYLEYQTDLGPIDLLGQSLTDDVIVEVKRKTATLKDVTQLKRYLEALEGNGRHIKGFLAAPAISKNAAKYLKKHQLEFVVVDFD